MDRSIRLCLKPLPIVCSLAVGFYLGSYLNKDHSKMNSLVSSVHLVDPDQTTINKNFTCIKTKKLLDLFSTTVCIHEGSDFVSSSVARDRMSEEGSVTRLLQILIRNPHLDVIDIGANIGVYTMFAAGALGRFTLAIDCYMPNIERIVRAVQIENIQNRVVLIQNALYAKSGEHIRLSNDQPSGLYLTNKTQIDKSNEYVVETIQFDDLLPILIEKGVRSVLIKIDIEGSESYLCESGSKIFELIDIQMVMMEWSHSTRTRNVYEKRYQFIVDFFVQLNYITTDEKCEQIDSANWRTSWPGNIYWIKKRNYKKNLC